MMTLTELLRFMRTHRLAVEASCAPEGGTQAALVGIAVTDAFEIVFDTLDTTRKARNLRASPRAAFVLGGWVDTDERTIQFEGIADEPVGAELEQIKTAYFAAWPDGPARAAWPGITYFRVRPTWIRFSDFNCRPPEITEFTSDQLPAAPANEDVG
jgi:pyridoxine/pyridoxamine 5'-phosphate oxidase